MANQRRSKEKKPRPSSDLDKKVDVHLFVIPKSLWRPDLRFAYNTICVESISCGFVRVLPSITLKSLRDEISQQLDCSLFPSSFIFLRSIGRCLTWVTPKQEVILKLRVFLPPLAPCPEIYILDANYLQLPEGAVSLPPLHSANAPVHSSLRVHGHPPHDTHCSYNGHIHHGSMHGYAAPYYHQQQHHPSHDSHPHSCTPPNLMPLPQMYNLPEDGANNCHGGDHGSHNNTAGYYPLDQIHKTVNDQQPNNIHVVSSNKNSHRDKRHHNVEQMQQQHQYVHRENGFNDCSGSRGPLFNQQANPSRGSHPAQYLHHKTDLNDCSGSRGHPFNQQANQSRGSHPAQYLHHESDLNDCSGSRGRPFNQHHPATDNINDHELLHEAPNNQHLPQSTYNLKIDHTSGVKRGHSANKCQETNELNSGSQEYSQQYSFNSTNTLHPQPNASLRQQSYRANPSCDQSNYRYDSNSHDQLSFKDKRSHFKHQRQDQTITRDSEIVEWGTDSGQFHQDQHGSSNGPCNDQQDNLETSYHKIKRSYPIHNQRVEDQERREVEADEQSPEVSASVKESIDQELDGQGEGIHKWRNQETTRHMAQQKQPQQPRRATQKSNKTGTGKGNAIRKRSATYPPGTGLRQSTRQKKGENKKKSQINSESHIPIPGTKSTGFSRSTANQHPNASRNDDFSRRLPLPSIGSSLNKGFVAKKSSTKFVSKSQPQIKRPSTQQTNEMLAQIRRLKEECDELSSNKAELSSVLRTMQHGIRTQREQADKEWKIKYFQEKKFTSTLENRIKKTKDDLQQLQRQIDRKQGNHLKDSLHTTSVSTEAPSELSNMKIRCKKNQASVQRLRTQLEAAKKRLAVERNARKTLENECKDLRRELLEKKIACTRTKREPVSTQS